MALVSYKTLNSTKAFLPVNTAPETPQQNTTYLLDSHVVTALVSNTDSGALPDPVTLTFRHKNVKRMPHFTPHTPPVCTLPTLNSSSFHLFRTEKCPRVWTTAVCIGLRLRVEGRGQHRDV